MPFKSVDKMDEKIAFLIKAVSGNYYFSHLCAEYGISRKTGYKLLKRFEREGEAGLHDRSCRPHSVAGTVSPELVRAIVQQRQPTKRAILGARKIRAELLKQYEANQVPSATTIHNVLRREGLVKPRKAPPRRNYPVNTKNNPEQCNEIWTIDYKGHFTMGNGRRCHPLTVCDSFSRCILTIKGQYRETFRNVRQVLRQLFRKNGQPRYLLSDNGACFASIQSPCGYGRLSYWLLDHGIQPLFADPGRPGQNGRHERMHRELKAYCCRPPAKNLQSQNRLLNEFTEFYNFKRPHEELDQRYPGQVYEPSTVSYRDKVCAPDYGAELMVRKVTSNGAFRWGSQEWVMVNQCLTGHYVGLRRLGELSYEVYYRDVSLGLFRLGDQVESGRYYRLISDRDLPQRSRDREERKRR